MAEQQTGFVYHHIELYKSESLGSGSYGGVCKAKCDGLLCAAKIMHPTLFDLRDPGATSYLRKFQEECRLLSLAKHPNVVQYLATYSDPETRLPVLLMELCDENLTRFLERSPGPLPYHTQLNISYDIALALVYLHSNGLIHRDLTGNNVLMFAGTRAKITDFGMSKLATINPRMTAFTLCPGNVLYMSPEALDEAKGYTDKLDIFSFGVLVIQILTRQFPNPTDRFCTPRDLQYDEDVRLVVPETQRRHAHLQLISDTHTLKPLALQCLKKKDRERPSAQQLSERLSELKLYNEYIESMQQAEVSSHNEDGEGVDIQIEELQQQIEQQRTQNRQLEQQLQGRRVLTEVKTQEVSQCHTLITQLQNTVEENRVELQQKQQNIQASEQLVSQLQENQQQKDRTISDLQQIISAHERKIRQLEQQATFSSTTRQLTATPDRWREGKKAPERMTRGTVVVYEHTAYFNPRSSHEVYSYQIISGEEEQWCNLPTNRNRMFSLAVIDGLVTSVGGYQEGCGQTNALLSLSGEGEKREWSEIFPPMPTARTTAVTASTEQVLVVVGGFYGGKCLDKVEVMNIATKEWTTVSPLPQALSSLTATICGDRLYLAGGFRKSAPPSKSVLTCSLTDVLPPKSLGDRRRETLSLTDVWQEICSLPVTHSTLATLSGHLLAIGGFDHDSNGPIADIHSYDTTLKSWNVIGQMKNDRSQCLAAVLPQDRLIVVGGYLRGPTTTDSIEILE